MFGDLLKGLKVIELASVLAGPSIGMFLAELGAEILKVENPSTGGDVTRGWKLSGEIVLAGRSAYFCSINWGKKSILLDLKISENKKHLYELIRSADVIICSFKEGDAEKLGFSYPQLKRINDQLIQLNIKGFTDQKNRVGYDAVVQAESGWWYINGEKESKGHKLPVALIDVLAGHQGKEAILAALLHREKNNEGCEINISLMDSALSGLVNQASNFLVAGKNPQPLGSEHPNIVPYGSTFICKDNKEIMLAIGSDKQFKLLCGFLKLDLEEKYYRNEHRVENRSEILEKLKTALLKFSSKSILNYCHKNFIPAGTVKSIAEALTQMPYGLLLEDERSGLRGIRSAVFAKGVDMLPPPALGEGSDD